MIGPETDFYRGEDLFSPRPYDEIIKGESYSPDNFLTIIVTTYNRLSLLKDAISSLLSQKTSIGFNILITDNNSDNEHRLPQEYIAGLEKKNIRYIRNHENLGMFGNMNQGLALAETEYVSFLHDDDLYDDCFVSEVWNLVEKNKNFNAIHVGVSKIVNGERRAGNNSKKLKRFRDWQMLFEGPGAPTGLVVKREVAIHLGGFNTEFHPTSDYCFGCMIASLSNYYKYSKTLCYYRVSENESMKAETLRKFVYNDYFLRNFILKKYSVCRKITRILQGYFVADQIRVLKSNYNRDFEYEIPGEFSIEDKVSYIEYILCRLYVEVTISLKGLFKIKR